MKVYYHSIYYNTHSFSANISVDIRLLKYRKLRLYLYMTFMQWQMFFRVL